MTRAIDADRDVLLPFELRKQALREARDRTTSRGCRQRMTVYTSPGYGKGWLIQDVDVPTVSRVRATRAMLEEW